MAETLSEQGSATYEDLAAIERELEDVEAEITAKQHILNTPIYHKRAAAISRIPNYWPLVFEQAPPDVDAFIQPSDSQVFATALKGFHVDRPEIPKLAKVEASGVENFGQPRSLAFRFEFEENEWFEDKVLEKTFYQRRSKDGFWGLVSDPVKIRWKSDKNLTGGLSDAAFALWQAQKESADNLLDGPFEGDALKKRDAAARSMPEYKKLREMMENSMEGVQSFFTWFAYRGPYVSAKENEIAEKEFRDKRQADKAGGAKVDAEDEDEDEDLDGDIESEVEVFAAGEQLALVLGVDIWPGANKYFMAAQELDVDGMEEDYDDDDDDDDDEEDDDGAIQLDMLKNIRKLVPKKNADENPSKKQKR